MLYLSTIRIFFLRICKLFFKFALNSLSLLIFLLYFLLLFRQISLINAIWFRFLHFSVLLSRFTSVLFSSLFFCRTAQTENYISSNNDINRLYLKYPDQSPYTLIPSYFPVRFCTFVLTLRYNSAFIIPHFLLPSLSSKCCLLPLQRITFCNLFFHINY